MSLPSNFGHHVVRIVSQILMLTFIGCSGSASPGGGEAGNGAEGGNGGAVGEPGEEPVVAETGQEFSCSSKKQTVTSGVVRRLTIPEYINSVRDLLGVDLSDQSKALLPRDTAHGGFTNDARAQTVSLEHVEGYDAMADLAVKRIADKKAFFAKYATCTQVTKDCFAKLVDKLGLKLFRRPVTETDNTALAPVFAFVETEKASFDELAELTLLSMLQSPHFLYLIEKQQGSGGTRALDGYEMATRLSYLFWRTTPDDALLNAAADGSLKDEDGIARETQRLVESERARKSSDIFVDNWLQLERLSAIQSPLVPDMIAETSAVFQKVVWDEGKPLPALFDTDLTIASKALAAHYKFAAPKDGVTQYDLATETDRKGILTHGSILTAGGEGASLVHRGIFVLENLLCSTVPPPPAGLNVERPIPQAGKTQRDYANERSSTSPCSGCHSYLDPLAFAMERFTGLGQPRTKDEAGNDLDTAGKLYTPYDEMGREFDGPRAFAEMLATDERVNDCMILKPVQYALGRTLLSDDACTLAAVRDALKSGEGVRYQDVLKHLVLQPGFRSVSMEN
jgi:Protein of unknown function (DUF1592)/Protein of unknown function (DUF1588)/Protein of unknown function (DUF1587)/Protein of unknown function (DUF1595)/Protein of unknown function (DUF1585)